MPPAVAPPSPPEFPALRMDVTQLNTFLARAFPHAEPGSRPEVVEVAPGRVRSVMPYSERQLRPGGVISGPTLMALADQATYAMVLAHIGEVPMAVTTSLTIHFLRGCRPGPLTAEATLLKLGRRIATADVRLWTDGSPESPAAQAVVAYALPGERG